MSYLDSVAMIMVHVTSIRRFMDLARQAGADVILSPTLGHANMPQKIGTWRLMNPDMSGNDPTDVHVVMAEVVRLEGEAHPFVSAETVERCHWIPLECCQAQLAWRTGA